MKKVLAAMTVILAIFSVQAQAGTTLLCLSAVLGDFKCFMPSPDVYSAEDLKVFAETQNAAFAKEERDRKQPRGTKGRFFVAHGETPEFAGVFDKIESLISRAEKLSQDSAKDIKDSTSSLKSRLENLAKRVEGLEQDKKEGGTE